MRIAILSLNPRHNYGGILQSYALKKVLEGMGHEVRVICKERYIQKFGIKQILLWPYRALRKLAGRKDVRIFREAYVNINNSIRFQHTDKFVDEYLNPRFISTLKEIKEGEFDAFVVGSDQVWRPKYFKMSFTTNIENAFLDFTKKWTVKRIAYAASLGVDAWEYTDEETEKCAQSIKLFDAISVRELSGANLCKLHLGVDAVQLCDPTLLLNKEDYNSLIPNKFPKSSGSILVYCLDKNNELDKFVERLSKEKDLTPYYFTRGIESLKVLPPVEFWIQSFRDAEFVLTDSFHGFVFSLIFKKPVYVFRNQNRGFTRMESLLPFLNNYNEIYRDGKEDEYLFFDSDVDTSLLQSLKNLSSRWLAEVIGRGKSAV